VPWQDVGDDDIDFPAWASGNCSADPPAPLSIPASTEILGSWSQSRLALAYFLRRREGRASGEGPNVKTLIYFDPGNMKDFAPPSNGDKIYAAIRGQPAPQTCDWQHPIADLLAAFVQVPGNQIIFVTGDHTAEPDENGKRHYSGLWKYYLAKIWNQPSRGRVRICDYPGMSHEAIIQNFWTIVRNPPASGCPAQSGKQAPRPWHP
jgi:hypothetical protein